MIDLQAAHFGIRQLHARLADAVWRQDADQFAACWLSDGLWKIAGMEVRCRAAMARPHGS